MYKDRNFKIKNLKKNQRIYILIVVMLIISIFWSRRDYNIKYKNKDFGIEFRLPRSWKNKYKLVEKVDGIYLYNKANYNNNKGLLFKLRREIGQNITAKDIYENNPRERLVTKGNGYSYIISFPKEIQYDRNNKKLAMEYSEMLEDIYGIVDRIKVIKSKKLDTKYSKFQRVASYYFELEIPRGWKLKVDSVTDSLWNIYNGQKRIGQIQLVPNYKSYKNKKGFYTKIICDKKNNRKYKITLEDKIKYEEDFEKILDTFKIRKGNYNSIDILNEAYEIYENGGTGISGYIGDFSMDDDKIDRINIKLRGDKEYKRLEYKVGKDARLVNSFNGKVSLYEHCQLNYDFFKNSEDIFDKPYNFIIDSDGKIFAIVERQIIN